MGKAAVAILSLILVVSALICTATAIANTADTTIVNTTATASSNATAIGGGASSGIMSGMKAVDTLCSPSDCHKDLCIQTLSPVAKGNTNATPKAFLEATVQATLKAVNKALNDSKSLDKDAKDKSDVSSLNICKEYIGYMVNDLEDVIPMVPEIETTTDVDSLAFEMKDAFDAVLSATLTCVEGMNNPKLKEALQGSLLLNITQLAENGMVIVDGITQSLVAVDRRLLEVENEL